VVLDSNLVVSAFLNPEGMASAALQVAVANFDVAASSATLAELADVLKRDKFDRYATKADRITRLEAYAQTVLVFDVQLEVTDCKDPKDNKFLALCSTAGAKVLVTGDKKDLLVMHPYQNTAVLGLRAFVDDFAAYL
jgi:putative PIN family toxin of toxin-antitoxin system